MKMTHGFQWWGSKFAIVCILVTTGCTGIGYRHWPADVPTIHPGILQGYLTEDQYPNSLHFLSQPPAEGSAAFASDQEISRESLALCGSPRWGLAIRDAGLSTYAAKNHYNRPRPFMGNQQPICTPEEIEGLRKDGSYPSGHSAIGWAWVLILSEVVPERTDAILARGYELGQSRVVCNVHWQSDVDYGRIIGAAAVARLHTNEDFLNNLKWAKREAAFMQKRLDPSTK